MGEGQAELKPDQFNEIGNAHLSITDFPFGGEQFRPSVAALQFLGTRALASLLRIPETANPVDLMPLRSAVMYDNRPGLVVRHGEGVLNEAFPFHAQHPSNPFNRSLLATPIAPRRRDVARDGLRRFWHRTVRRKPAEAGSSAMGSLLHPLAFSAFHSADFHRIVRRGIFEALRDRVLIDFDDMLSVKVAWQTIFVLALGFERPKDLPSIGWDRLAETARNAASEPSWAGFWDIWLLRKAIADSRFSLGPRLQGDTIKQFLANPLDSEQSISDIVRADWRNKGPAFAEAFLSLQSAA